MLTLFLRFWRKLLRKNWEPSVEYVSDKWLAEHIRERRESNLISRRETKQNNGYSV